MKNWIESGLCGIAIHQSKTSNRSKCAFTAHMRAGCAVVVQVSNCLQELHKALKESRELQMALRGFDPQRFIRKSVQKPPCEVL